MHAQLSTNDVHHHKHAELAGQGRDMSGHLHIMTGVLMARQPDLAL